MTTTSIKMNRHSIASIFLVSFLAVLTFGACKKNSNDHHSSDASKFSAEVVDKWMTMQIRLMRNTTTIPNHALSRQFAYTGIATLESLSPDNAVRSKSYGKWNGLAGLPIPNPSARYYYPANVNAAMASINRALFPNASSADKMAIDSLETVLNDAFLTTQPAAIINRSNDFGKSVAAVIFSWSETDGYKNADPYTPPVKDGLWVPTTPGAKPASPYWGKNRTLVAGSINNTQPDAPIIYSAESNSDFYKMAKHVYDVSQTLTDDQKAMAIFWRDIPGISSPGHWLSILKQVIGKTNTRLDKAALAYALTGASIHDAIISCWKTKYKYNLVRPLTYIRNVMGHATWSPYIGTPSHPEYSSGHAVLSSAGATAMKELFGNIGSFTDHTYDYMGLPSRTYSSFAAIAEEAAISRIYGGIHFKETADLGLIEGSKVASNVLSKYYGRHHETMFSKDEVSIGLAPVGE
jgi:hypothetical protein